ncbi:MAG: glycosyltransferase [Oscillospiraceae bacterium]
MNILVLDVAATESGALIILNEYYQLFSKEHKNNYFFCVSTPSLEDTDNIKVLSFPWVKKSWFHRLWFDNHTCKKIIKENKIDEIFSLQNTVISGAKIPQTLYLHQPLPFVKYKYRFFQNVKMWTYQNIISRFIFSSIHKAKKVIVQTKWMKEAVIEKTGIDSNIIEIKSPIISTVIHNKFSTNWNGDLFYPASNYEYKNHYLILKALLILKQSGFKIPKLYLTLKKEELPKKCNEIFSQLEDNVVLLGGISHDEVMDYYSKNALIFPSYIETFGLPLLEARMVGSPILASDCPFSNEILEGYANSNFFDPFDENQLANQIKKLLEESAIGYN